MAEHAQRFVANPIDVSTPRDVGSDHVRRRADFRRDALQRVWAARRKNNPIAAASELARDGGADPGARACDDDNSIQLW